ncbi:hypothetical protein [Lewinella sp. IMCC34183]|uniref:hypothetical protein n=1 Tax=Lewinella sp. IMCC34183 TaxID=2248762 RepID=UPI000E24AB4E|nr:hypothetical protein [Lewinella sp. IMCC34183]
MYCALLWSSLLISALHSPLTSLPAPPAAAAGYVVPALPDSMVAPVTADIPTVDVCYGQEYRGEARYTDAVIGGPRPERVHVIVPGKDAYVTGPNVLCGQSEEELGLSQTFHTYAWDNGSNAPVRQVAGPGTYRVTVTNAAGCAREFRHTVATAAVRVAGVDAVRPLCPGSATGSLSVRAGGPGPLLYAVDDAGYQQTGHFDNLAAGQYTVRVQTLDGCTAERTVRVPAATPLRLFGAGHRTGTAVSGEAVPLPVAPNFTVTEIDWAPAAALSCADCTAPRAATDRDRVFTAEARSPAGCLVRDTFTLRVTDDQLAYVPASFHAEQPDPWKLYPGPGVTAIGDLAITDAEGTVWRKQARALPPDDPRLTWNGESRGSRAESGAYRYTATLYLHDGRETTLTGTFNLTR